MVTIPLRRLLGRLASVLVALGLASSAVAIDCCPLLPAEPPSVVDVVPDAEQAEPAGLRNAQEDLASTANTQIEDKSDTTTYYSRVHERRVRPQKKTSPSRLTTNIFASKRINDAVELGVSTDYPVRVPQLYVSVRAYRESRWRPSIYLGAMNALALNDFGAVGLFSPTRTTAWAVLSQAFLPRHQLRLSVGAIRTWQDGRVRPVGSLDFEVLPAVHARIGLFGRTVYPGVNLRAADRLWIRTDVLLDRKALALRVQWKPSSSWEF